MALIAVLGAPALTLPAERSGELAVPPCARCCARTAFVAAPASTRHHRAATTDGRETRRRAALRSIRAAHGGDSAPDAHAGRDRRSQDGGRTFVRLIPRADGFDLATARVALSTARGQNLTLVATIHLGERRYFEELQADLERHDTVLYELVVGKECTQARGSMRRLEARVEPSPAQVFFSRKYGLEHQLEVMRMDNRDTWFIADLDRDEMLALREESLEQLSLQYVRGVENPAWIQAATALRCALLCVNGPHPFYFLACPSTHARTRACSHARVHNRTNAHTRNTHTNQSRRDGAVVPEWGGGVASRKQVAHVTVPCCYIGCFSPLPRSVGSHHLLAPPLIIHWFRV